MMVRSNAPYMVVKMPLKPLKSVFFTKFIKNSQKSAKFERLDGLI
jgi:hypothetical protein